MENIGNNLIFKCKTRKMDFLYAPKHKHMTPILWCRFETGDQHFTDAGAGLFCSVVRAMCARSRRQLCVRVLYGLFVHSALVW